MQKSKYRETVSLDIRELLEILSEPWLTNQGLNRLFLEDQTPRIHCHSQSLNVLALWIRTAKISKCLKPSMMEIFGLSTSLTTVGSLATLPRIGVMLNSSNPAIMARRQTRQG
jgi:hypothetical protein